MGRKAYHGTAKDQNGRVIYNATVSIYTAGTTTAATCYASEAGAALSGGVTTSDAYGAFEFWVDSADYTQNQEFKVVISKSGYTSVTYDYIHVPGFGLETTDSPTFANPTFSDPVTDSLTVNDLTASKPVFTGASKELSSSGTLAVNQGGTGVTTAAGLASLVGNLLFPIGSIFISITSTNPGTSLGFGTWVTFGAGKTLVSLDSGDVSFDVAEETGGAKTHTLTTDEIPAHYHTIEVYTGGTASVWRVQSLDTNTSPATGTTSTLSAGGGSAHNNLQPYIVVYMWKRTA